MEKTVQPGALSGTLAVLPSKSASHRAVMMAAMAQGTTQIAPLQLSRDIKATLDCARALGLMAGADVSGQEGSPFVCARIEGGAHMEEAAPLRTLDCGESGSTLRFFIPLALDGRGPVRFVGHGRLMQRPLSVYEPAICAARHFLGARWRHADGSGQAAKRRLCAAGRL